MESKLTVEEQKGRSSAINLLVVTTIWNVAFFVVWFFFGMDGDSAKMNAIGYVLVGLFIAFAALGPVSLVLFLKRNKTSRILAVLASLPLLVIIPIGTAIGVLTLMAVFSKDLKDYWSS
jgi:hypothetical protein